MLESTTDSSSRAWVRVRLAILPNSATGWVPQDALGAFHSVRTRLVIDRRALRAVLWRGGRVVFRAPVGIGEPRWPTPRGEFYVREKLTDFGDPFYGPVAFGTSARSPILTDWPGGGVVGIHGTDRPEPHPGPYLARVHPHAECGHSQARLAHAARHTDHHPLVALLGL